MAQIFSTLIEYPIIGVALIADSLIVDVIEGILTFESSYNKYDKLEVDVFGVTIKNIGSNNHRELEDTFENAGSGLPSALSQVQQSNIIKYGIFNEKNWQGEQSDLSTPWQAEYIIPRDQTWYDKINSTIDYSTEISSDDINVVLPLAASAFYLKGSQNVLVGGYGGAISIDIDDFKVEYLNISSLNNPFINDFHNELGTYYTIDGRNIYSSPDAVIWTIFDRTGLPNKIHNISSVNNTLVVGASDGIYFKTPQQDTWSLALASINPVEVTLTPDLLFALVDNTVYYTSNGVGYVASGTTQATNIYDLTKFKPVVFAATDKGLRKDDGTFYGAGSTLSLVDIFNNVVLSAAVVITSVDSNDDVLVGGISDGRFVVMQPSGFATITNAPLDSIQKVLIQGDRVWLFGYDQFVIYENLITNPTLVLEYAMQLSTGVPV